MTNPFVGNPSLGLLNIWLTIVVENVYFKRAMTKCCDKIAAGKFEKTVKNRYHSPEIF